MREKNISVLVELTYMEKQGEGLLQRWGEAGGGGTRGSSQARKQLRCSESFQVKERVMLARERGAAAKASGRLE